MRSFDMNVGYLELPLIPDDKFIAGAVIVLMDADGNTSTQFVAESLDHVPDIDVQRELGAAVEQAWQDANLEPATIDWSQL